MKKIAILSLLVLTSIVTNGQENVKKCITTRLVEQIKALNGLNFLKASMVYWEQLGS